MRIDQIRLTHVRVPTRGEFRTRSGGVTECSRCCRIAKLTVPRVGGLCPARALHA
jgi:hypothetical protein